jgi:hypothetical protein
MQVDCAVAYQLSLDDLKGYFCADITPLYRLFLMVGTNTSISIPQMF